MKHNWYLARVTVAGGALPYGLCKRDVCYCRKVKKPVGERSVAVVRWDGEQGGIRFLQPEQARRALELGWRLSDHQSEKIEAVFRHLMAASRKRNP